MTEDVIIKQLDSGAEVVSRFRHLLGEAVVLQVKLPVERRADPDGKGEKEVGRHVVHNLDRYLNTLGTIASITPLLGLLGTTAKRFGAVDTWGLLHNLPITHGWKGGDADEKAFRGELARRTTTVLTTSFDGIVFVATRHYDGRTEYFTRE